MIIYPWRWNQCKEPQWLLFLSSFASCTCWSLLSIDLVSLSSNATEIWPSSWAVHVTSWEAIMESIVSHYVFSMWTFTLCHGSLNMCFVHFLDFPSKDFDIRMRARLSLYSTRMASLYPSKMSLHSFIFSNLSGGKPRRKQSKSLVLAF